MVIAQLNSALAVSGLQVLHTLELGMAGGGGLIARASLSPQKQVRPMRILEGVDFDPIADLTSWL